MARIFKYSKVFSLKVMHRYYTALLSGDLLFEPSGETRRTLGRYGIACRNREDGFDLYVETGDDDLLKKPVTENLRMTFFAKSLNSYFENFTELPIERPANQILYFNNLTVNQVNVFNLGSQEFLLNKGNQVSGADYIDLVTNQYQFAHTAAGTSKVFRLFRQHDNVQADELTVSAVSGVYLYQNKLENIEPGCYRLETDGAEINRFYYHNDPRVRECVAIVDIFTDVPDELTFIENGNEPAAKTCAIAFLNRSTRWRYKVTNRNGIEMPDPAVAIGNDTGLFTNLGGLVFVSNNPMPLQQAPITGIRILKNAAITSSEALGNLSNASLEQVLPEEDNGSYTLYSDIFIYL